MVKCACPDVPLMTVSPCSIVIGEAEIKFIAFAATTFGLKFGIATSRDGELSLRLEQYQQRPSDQASSLAELQGLDLNPNLKATIVQLSYHLEY